MQIAPTHYNTALDPGTASMEHYGQEQPGGLAASIDLPGCNRTLIRSAEHIRAARASDLASMYLVYRLNEVSEVEAEGIGRALPQSVPSVLRHVFETGTMAVAEQDGHVIAFAGAITRGSEQKGMETLWNFSE